LQKEVAYKKEGVLVVLDIVIIGMGGRRRLFSGKRDDIYTCACCFDSKYVHHWV
jgi:hypothetical protein